MGKSGGQVVQNVSGTHRLIRRKVGLVPNGHNIDVVGMYVVVPLVPLP